MRVRALTLAAMLLVGGCAVVPYPRDWPAAVSGDEHCVSLSGDYENVGYSVQPNNPLIPLADDRPGYLTQALLGRRDTGSHKVRLDVRSTGQIVVTTLDAEGKPQPVELQAEDVHCTGGQLRLAIKGGLAGGGLVAAAGADSVSLSRAADGSLIVETYSAVVGLVPVPMAAVARGWTRFPVWGSTPTAADRVRSGKPYDWPRTSSPASPPVLLRERKPLYGAYSNDADERWNRQRRSDCSPDPGDPSIEDFARVREALVTVSPAEAVEEAFRAKLAPPVPAVARTSYAPAANARVADASEFGARHGARAVVVVDIQVQFGTVQRGSCFVKLYATADVRVQPTGDPESGTALYDIWARLHRVPVQAWALDPARARMELQGLLRQIGEDLAISYREWDG